MLLILIIASVFVASMYVEATWTMSATAPVTTHYRFDAAALHDSVRALIQHTMQYIDISRDSEPDPLRNLA
jgi:hypothetical protein